MIFLKVDHLSLRLGNKAVLNDVSFQVREGEFRLVIGPNGAGKSSLLKCILGFYQAGSGTITLAGRLNATLPQRERARMVAYVPQFLEMQFNLDVWSFMKLSRFAHDDETAAVRDKLILGCMEATDTVHLKDAYLDELSGGERQRILFAAALAQEPKLLVLDEPTTSLDPAHRMDLILLLERLYLERKLSILLVTHHWNEFAHLNPDILALREGRVAFECATEYLPAQLDGLFDCRFQHFTLDDQVVSVPRAGQGGD